ncbi:MAG: J domain-containing protein [Oscillospiraceae bacterium]
MTDEIRQAYRTLAKKYHPDLNPNDPTAAQKMNEVNEAYDLLKNPQAYRQQQAQQRYQQQARQQYQNQQYYDPFSAFWGGQSQSGSAAIPTRIIRTTARSRTATTRRTRTSISGHTATRGGAAASSARSS